MNKINFDELPVSSDSAMSQATLQARMQEHKWNLIIWAMFTYPVFLAFLAYSILYFFYFKEMTWIGMAILAIWTVLGFSVKPNKLFKIVK